MSARTLTITYFGNPVLREPARRLTKQEIASTEIQQLITDIKHTVDAKKYGVGLAAPQVGIGVSLALIAIKPTPTRPNRELFDKVIINPEIVKTHGKRVPMWEGCISFGKGANTPYAKALRYKEIDVTYFDETGKKHSDHLSGLVAHVFQHELDHLNGVLFVDRVKDNKSFVLATEFRKRILPTLPKET